MPTELDPIHRGQMLSVIAHMKELGYLIRPASEPVDIVAYTNETVSINISFTWGGVIFQSLWTCSDYARNNYFEYIGWVNSLNLESLAVKFSVNYMGAMVITSNYFGLYEKWGFDVFYSFWKKDIDKVWNSKECW